MDFGNITSCFKPKRAEAKKTVNKPQNCSPQRISLIDVSYPDGSEMSMSDLSNSLVGSNLFVFTHDELRLITNNFALSNFLGEGGVGAVYKGFIDDKLKPGLGAQLVAVKMLDLEGTQGHKEWLAEVIFLGQLRHHHLVKLIGYCHENDQRSLVYEYMERGNLDSQLFRRCSAPLPWLTRMKIAVESAKGLAFLHEEKQAVIFRDFKAANILLSPDYTAKLSDFGFARDGPGDDKTHMSTQNILGTKGYVAPEYIMTGHLTTMSDVYSYGVVLLELLTGRRCMDKSRPGKEQSLVDWARPRLKDSHKLDLIMDPRLEGQYSAEGAKIAALLAYQCLSHKAKTRPTMGTVVKTLDPLLEIKGKGGGCVSLSHEGLDKQEVDIEEVHDHNINLSSPDLLQSSRVEMQLEVRDGDRDAGFTLPPPPLPPPPPPSFYLDSGLPSTRKIRRNCGFNSQGAEYNSKLEKSCDDQLPDLVVPSNEIESFSKGILFLLGEGCEFEKEKLVQLWMALGFINDEINGPTYFETLVSEGYILLSDSNTLYKVNAERVNSDLDIIRDKSKYLILESTNQHNVEPEEILHVSVVCDEVNDAIFKMLGKFNKLVTLLFHGTCGPRLEHLSLDLFLSFVSLLVLDLSGTDIKELPSSVGKMVHLRYLDLSWTLIELLPESVSCLQRLQTLRLKGCSRIRRLPRDMKMLTELRHLEFNVLGQLTVMPKGLSALIKLRTLSSFLVGTQKGFDIRELGDLNNLAGEFCIARLENVKSADDAKSASITSKSCLTKLELRWSDFPLRDLKNEVADDTVLENLRPPSDLEELRIRCYAGTDLPSWIADESFHRLARITLFKCEHVSMLPSLQTLPSVEYLELISLNSVIQVDVRGEIGHVAFPRLQTLVIDEMLNLKTWTEARECDFPCLVELTIKGCPNLSDLPSLLYLSSMKRLEMSFCPQVQFSPDKKLSTSLEFLIVYDCPLIKESCWGQGGRQWELIKHVPNIWIDQEEILGGVDYDSDMVGAYDHYGIETDDDDDDDDDRELLLSEDENEK